MAEAEASADTVAEVQAAADLAVSVEEASAAAEPVDLGNSVKYNSGTVF